MLRGSAHTRFSYYYILLYIHFHFHDYYLLFSCSTLTLSLSLACRSFILSSRVCYCWCSRGLARYTRCSTQDEKQPLVITLWRRRLQHQCVKRPFEKIEYWRTEYGRLPRNALSLSVLFFLFCYIFLFYVFISFFFFCFNYIYQPLFVRTLLFLSYSFFYMYISVLCLLAIYMPMAILAGTAAAARNKKLNIYMYMYSRVRVCFSRRLALSIQKFPRIVLRFYPRPVCDSCNEPMMEKKIETNKREINIIIIIFHMKKYIYFFLLR